jgi:manganese/zinc/iron transport system permease protein
MSSDLAIVLTGVLVSAACALLGSFLVLRRMAMMADAISHAILPGLVAGFFLAQGPSLWAGMLGAAVAALATVLAVETLVRSRRVANDAAIGIVFPAMFALGTVVVSRYFANVHLDADAILYGNIEFSGLDTLVVGGVALGPQSVWLMGALCLINLALVVGLYKELKLSTFDSGLAASLGFAPLALHYLLMAAVSLTAVGAFSAVGAVLAVSLLVVPAATARLLTDRLPRMIALAVLVGALAAVLGFAVAIQIDSSIAGAMATMAGVLFAAAFLLAPERGLVPVAWRRRQQRRQFALDTLAVHLAAHAGTPDEARESAVAHLSEALRWTPSQASAVVGDAVAAGLVRRTGGQLALTPAGAQRAREVAPNPARAQPPTPPARRS